MAVNRDELLFVVDEHNHPITPLARRDVHAKRLWHRASHIWIVNRNSQILCQLRSANMDFNPNMWSPYFGGHVAAGTEFIDAAVIEVGEELGLKIKPAQLKLNMVYKDMGPDRKFEAIYLLDWSGDIEQLTPEQEEVSEIAWKNMQQIEQAYQDPKSNWVCPGYQLQMLEWIKQQS